MKKIITIVLIVIISFSSLVYGEEFEKDVFGVLLSDYETGEILYSDNIDKKLNIASITKLMTYTVTMDAIKEGKVYYEDIVTIGENPPKEWGSTFYLEEDEKLKLKTLLESIMIASGNDSCVAIAEYVAGSEDAFIKLMNEKAKELGLENTKYVNTNGLPEDDGTENIMTIREINKLAKYILDTYPEILKITDKRSIEVSSRDYIENTNPLLRDMPLVDGLKTGNTDGAGYCLVSTMINPVNEDNDKEMRIIGIIMGTKSKKDRKEKSEALLNYAIDNFKYEEIITRDKGINIKINEAKNSSVNVVPEEDKYIFINKEDEIKTKIILDENQKFPIEKGEKIGMLEVYKNGKNSKNIDLYSNKKIKKANIFVRLFRWLFR
ncbi:D-alanyl-D-alanine carboxypeptidase [Clostridium sp. D2Q-14]|uniref:D-alanyl-D-alanine carboxypeptidase family protein n=1 Tax=Anaeromonas gelatinilytica TaxID=2683194 RepID=UPI00193B0955|nr:D-alanyl-D-alanine carboxypeptidase family protein [Anaeromonas gelatinilytica]MBS4534007.1 D-alanyl-D-alanine carboxypeptidase [Anaeromonas gelatinilytica]